jgi:3-deoxy-D-manno-octulosonic-acid transferase
LGVFFYNIFLVLFKGIMPIAALFNPKAKKWVQGRRNIFERLQKVTAGHHSIIWIHCASLGEFEQGRPLIEKLKADPAFKHAKFLLTFFSPSGYEIRKEYKGADWVFYLPMDGPRNAKRFLEIVNPSLVIFVKYEFWYYYLKKIKYRNIPLILVSALFWKEMSFFKWYGAMQRKMLSRFDHLFVQDQLSKQLLDDIGLSSITSISGDTRFDRVIDIAESAEPLPLIEQFIKGNKTIIAGSTWPEDETVLKQTLDTIRNTNIKLIIAPHEISEKHIASVIELFPGSIRYSKLGSDAESNVLIIDNIGLLSRLYKYATITYIGGGFGKGIHNTLEAAVYAKPVIFGPVFHKFREAADLIRAEGAFTISSADESVKIINQLLSDDKMLNESGKGSGDYVYSNRGAANRIIEFLKEKEYAIRKS